MKGASAPFLLFLNEVLPVGISGFVYLQVIKLARFGLPDGFPVEGVFSRYSQPKLVNVSRLGNQTQEFAAIVGNEHRELLSLDSDSGILMVTQRLERFCFPELLAKYCRRCGQQENCN